MFDDGMMHGHTPLEKDKECIFFIHSLYQHPLFCGRKYRTTLRAPFIYQHRFSLAVNGSRTPSQISVLL